MGLERARPVWLITANDQDVTGVLRERFSSLRIVDSTGLESDSLELVLTDTDPAKPIQRPKKGAELEAWLGYPGDMVRMGLYVFDEWAVVGWPQCVTIRARAAVYESTPKGKTDLQTQKKRSWPRGTKLGDMVAKIAKEHGMLPAVGQSLKNLALPHLDQTAESDISFLLRVTKQYDAIVKPASGRLLVVRRGEAKTVSGKDMPRVVVRAEDCSRFECIESAKDGAGTVVAYWNDKKGGRLKKVVLGSGEPVRQLRHPHPSEAAAIQAAQAELDKRGRAQNKLSLTMPGNTAAVAEGTLELSGFRAEMNHDWLITRVEHTLGANGYSCDIEAEEFSAD